MRSRFSRLDEIEGNLRSIVIVTIGRRWGRWPAGRAGGPVVGRWLAGGAGVSKVKSKVKLNFVWRP